MVFCSIHFRNPQTSTPSRMFDSSFFFPAFFLSWEVFYIKFILEVLLLSLLLSLKVSNLKTRLLNVSRLTELASKRDNNCNIMDYLTCFVICHITNIKNCWNSIIYYKLWRCLQSINHCLIISANLLAHGYISLLAQLSHGTTSLSDTLSLVCIHSLLVYV